jgi:sugar phosphate permease
MSPSGQSPAPLSAAVALSGERIAVFLTCLGHFFSHFYLLVLPPLFPLIKGEFAVSFTALGAVIMARSIGTIVAQYPMGVLVDRYAARYFLIGGLALTGLAVALLSVTTSYGFLLALAFLAGLGNSVFHPANYAILEETVSESRLGRAYSAHTLSGNIGWVLAPLWSFS